MYTVNEVFRSMQGEGARAGSTNVFVRFTGCNMRCAKEAGPKSPGGFDCDTEFESGRSITTANLIEWIRYEDEDPAGEPCRAVILTGGEPGLQADASLLAWLRREKYFVAIETNGSIALPDGFDWITVSPKVAEHCIRQREADEVKYVRGYGQALPKTVVEARHKYISPTFNGSEVDKRALEWCKQLVEGTEWKLSMQGHKLLNLR